MSFSFYKKKFFWLDPQKMSRGWGWGFDGFSANFHHFKTLKSKKIGQERKVMSQITVYE